MQAGTQPLARRAALLCWGQKSKVTVRHDEVHVTAEPDIGSRTHDHMP
jgi:hypothetical protein